MLRKLAFVFALSALSPGSPTLAADRTDPARLSAITRELASDA
ncbi:MAG: hypothetical protein ACK5SU_09205 [Phenylobacterium sp.]